MKTKTQMVLVAMFVLLLGSQSWAIEASFDKEMPLDGTTIHYRYTFGWEFELRFYDGMLAYTWMASFRERMEQGRNLPTVQS